MISPLLSSGRLQWLREHEPVAVDRVGNRVTAVTVRDLRADVQVRLSAPLIVDATDLGDLLELGDVEHVIGAEASSEVRRVGNEVMSGCQRSHAVYTVGGG